MVAAHALQPPPSPPAPPGTLDQRVLLHDVSWANFELLLAIRGDHPAPRLTFLEGELELLSPSRNHEALKTLIGRLLETYADVMGLTLEGYGSMTLKSAPRLRGAEPDECYAIGAPKDHPDLAIEVVWSHGGLDRLEVYRGLGVREVWVWQDDALSVHVLRGDEYVPSGRSEALPELDLALLTSFLSAESQTQAVRDYRAALRSLPRG